MILYAVTLTAVMGVASITPAFPQIARELAISADRVGWLITIFTLPGVILTPVMGILADRLGRKIILVPSLLLFGVAGTCCALTRDFGMLLVFRFLQGVGAASLGSLNVTLIGDLFHGRDRAAAMGYNSSILSIGTAVYPALGGALAAIGWHYPFFFPLLALPVGFLVFRYLNNPEPSRHTGFREYFRNALKGILTRKVLGIFILSIATFIILYGCYLVCFPLLMDERFSASAPIIGVIMSVMSLTTALISSQLGRLMGLFSGRILMIFGFALYSLSLFLIPEMPSTGWVLIPVILFGVAHGLNIPSIQTMLAALAPMEYRAAFMAINGMVLRIGQTLGPIVMGFALSTGGFSMAFITGSLLSISMIILILFAIR
ncbi:MAG: MFS transporter [Bacteroidales bacterium]|nr:MFS transporter [Bacteroidales bacterium]